MLAVKARNFRNPSTAPHRDAPIGSYRFNWKKRVKRRWIREWRIAVARLELESEAARANQELAKRSLGPRRKRASQIKLRARRRRDGGPHRLARTLARLQLETAKRLDFAAPTRSSEGGACNVSVIRFFSSATLNGFARSGMPYPPPACRISACPDINNARKPWWWACARSITASPFISGIA